LGFHLADSSASQSRGPPRRIGPCLVGVGTESFAANVPFTGANEERL
jgi:hypothetical protein